MQEIIERALYLKQKLVNFVYDAEGEIAIALESYVANNSNKNSYGIKQQSLIIDLFIIEETVNQKTILELFIASTKNLDIKDIELIKLWQNNFVGLFEITAVQGDIYQLFNWLTAKKYQVYSHSQIPEKEKSRLQPGEIILTILAPINNSAWFIFSDLIIKGKLSKPKLAVAIGEFRDNYANFLYADAPELLEQAWKSVAVYHQEFVDYMGTDNLTLPGSKLEQKINKLRQKMTQKRLAEAGINSEKSLSEILSESGTDKAKFYDRADMLGVDPETAEKIVKNKDKISMVMPKVDLPSEIKQAETVTVFSHPQWGQTFLPNFAKFTNLLSSPESLLTKNLDLALQYIHKYLEKSEANYYIWQQLKQKYPQNLTKILQKYTNKNNFNLELDLNNLLLNYGKKSNPELPEIASVPIHLNDLFELAVAQVQKNKSKTKKKKKKKGFMN